MKRAPSSRPRRRFASVTVGCISFPEANRTWLGTGRLGAYAKKASLIKSGERTAACSNRMDIKHGNTNRNTSDVRLTSELGTAPARVEKKDIRGRSSHIDTDHSDLFQSAVAIFEAPTTPPAGPDNIVRTGSAAAVPAEIIPPEDCMTWTRLPSYSVTI